jgi:Ribbon-helix-helix protein, copG family
MRYGLQTKYDAKPQKGDFNHSMKHYTKRPLEKTVIFRAYARDVELLRAAAAETEVSQSDFIRQALREKAGRVLLGDDAAQEPMEAT